MLWQMEPFLRYMWNSAYTAIIITVVVLFNSAMFAYALTHIRFRWKKLLITLIMVTYIMPATTTYVPSYVILFENGTHEFSCGICGVELCEYF